MPPHDPDVLFNSALCDQRPRLAGLIGADAFGFGGYAADADVPSAELFVEPVVFKKMLACDQTAKDDSQKNQKNACTGIGARTRGLP